MVRKKLICDGLGNVHKRAMQYVTAVSQSEAVERILPILTEEEAAVYKRGRNSTHVAPKSASHAQYSRATGLECLFAYLYLLENEERLQQLFDKAFPSDV